MAEKLTPRKLLDTETLPVVRKLQWKPIYIVSILLLLAIIGTILGFSMYGKARHDLAQTRKELQDLKQNSGNAAEQENAELVRKVGQLIVLPTDEQPTIATVTDLSKLQGQPFFANAQVGDKVLIYTQNKKAILYRPSENKVIEVAPLNTQTDNATNPNPSSSAGSSNPPSTKTK